MKSMTNPARFGRTAALLAALALALTGCSADKNNLPSLGGSKAAEGNELVAVAKSFYDCMSEAGVKVELIDNGNGELTYVNFSFDRYMASTGPDGQGGGGGSAAELTEAEDKAMQDFMNTSRDSAGLLLDGVDYSEPYARCLASSGYDESKAFGDNNWQPDPKQIASQIKTNNEWAACARQNGWPDIKDAVMPTDLTNMTWPSIELPNTITEDQLRQLTAACPTFNAEKAEKLDQWYNDNPGSMDVPEELMNPFPSVGISVPNLPSAEAPATPSPDEQAALDRYTKLTDILYAEANTYYQSKYGDVSGTTEIQPSAEAS